MTVHEIADGVEVKPNHVYVIPPNKNLAIFHGVLQLTELDTSAGTRMPIDFFLRSLGEDQGDRSVAVILSGTGSDGTLGLRAVQGSGGTVFVQDPASAKYDGMPRSATGEEAYSIAMLLREYAEETKKDYRVQMFTADIDEDSIRQARTGFFPLISPSTYPHPDSRNSS